MIAVISGTNRPDSSSLKIAGLVSEMLRSAGEQTKLLDLARLPEGIFRGSSYGEKPVEFEPFQEAILTAHGILTVVAEYNGSFPGALKYFIDMLQFPESLYEKPAAFVGISAGPWGAIRAVEQLEMVYQYRHAHLFGRRVFIPNLGKVLDEKGALTDPALEQRLREMTTGFAGFCGKLC
ncbi:MAG: NADPH-dependent FMN reductase [Thermoanaerobaculales bacterium]